MSLVSVIIPTYNQSHYLAEAIQSILDQTFKDFEIVVVDDGSTDDTRVVALSFDHPQVRYQYRENGGLSAARNTGILCSQGEFLSFLDSDDLFAANNLELLAGKLKSDPRLGLVAGQTIVIDENGRFLNEKFASPPPDDLSRLLNWNPIQVCSVMVRRSWQERAGLFDESLRAYEDWDMWLRLARLGCRMGWVDEPVSLYRFHTAQMTRDRERMTTATFAVLFKTFADPDLPAGWREKKDLAYSNAYLRAAIQAYRTEEYPEAISALEQAIQLDPALAANRGELLARRLSALADSPKARDKLDFLERIYVNLPADLADLQRERRKHLAQAAVELGFAAHEKGDLARARAFLWKAVRFHPAWLLNRGVLSVLLRSKLFPGRYSKERGSRPTIPTQG